MKRKVFVERIPAPFATLYEKATRLAVKTYYGGVADEILNSIREGRILDLGTGPGILPIEVLRRSPDLRVDGIDLGRRLIAMARARASGAGVADRVTFQTANAANLPFPADTYDLVVSTGMLHMLKDPLRVLDECCRVLKPGCEAWIYDPAQVCSRIDLSAWKGSLTPIERILYQIFRLYSRINPGHTYTHDEVIALVRKTEFRSWQIREQGIEIRIKLMK